VIEQLSQVRRYETVALHLSNPASSITYTYCKGRIKLSLCFNRASRHEGVLGEWSYGSRHSTLSSSITLISSSLLTRNSNCIRTLHVREYFHSLSFFLIHIFLPFVSCSTFYIFPLVYMHINYFHRFLTYFSKRHSRMASITPTCPGGSWLYSSP